MITGTIDLKDYQLRVNNIDVELNLDPSLPKTMLDEHQLQQVFLNLINNAQHAIAEKGVRGRISIKTTFEDNIIRATVSDTGKGIPNDSLKKIFDPFFTTKEVGAGTGLGLSISYGIIKEHGGNIY
ncbi:MAG: multi-sensor hybrid histidine kinase, partial [Deltaproteobacteria bacterium]|nr:multi-sensor hybrid histidine kinase [Deltaproteobacteria bacterium]